MIRVGVVTTNRADFSIYRPVLRAIEEQDDMALSLFVGGSHLSRAHGMTVTEIEEAGIPIASRLDVGPLTDQPTALGHAMARMLDLTSQAIAEHAPHILMVLGDRYEMHAAAAAAIPHRLPVAHLHGGELTKGAQDDALRHSITKLSHLHFVSTEAYARRVRQLGEEPWRVHVTGAPALDRLRTLRLDSPEALAARFGIRFDPRPLLVTLHPETLTELSPVRQAEILLAAVARSGQPAIFTAPNADAGGQAVRAAVDAYVASRDDAWMVENFGGDRYFSAMAACAAMVGNSSSGIIEAASLTTPVVNVGGRQDGRVSAANVITVPFGETEIAAAIDQAVSPAFRRSLHGLVNPYGDGTASRRIVDVLHRTPLDMRLLRKDFVDV